MYSIIIPVYNGAPYVEETVQEIQGFLSTAQDLYEFIFVDDGSTDATYKMLQSLKEREGLPWLHIVHYKKIKAKARP